MHKKCLRTQHNTATENPDLSILRKVYPQKNRLPPTGPGNRGAGGGGGRRRPPPVVPWVTIPPRTSRQRVECRFVQERAGKNMPIPLRQTRRMWLLVLAMVAVSAPSPQVGGVGRRVAVRGSYLAKALSTTFLHWL
jgi:hypothetical protein